MKVKKYVHSTILIICQKLAVTLGFFFIKEYKNINFYYWYILITFDVLYFLKMRPNFDVWYQFVICITFLWLFSLTFGIAFAPLNSAKLSWSSEVTLFFLEGTAEDSYRSVLTLGKFNNGVFFSLYWLHSSNRQSQIKNLTWLSAKFALLRDCRYLQNKSVFQILTFRFIICCIIYGGIFCIFCTLFIEASLILLRAIVGRDF